MTEKLESTIDQVIALQKQEIKELKKDSKEIGKRNVSQAKCIREMEREIEKLERTVDSKTTFQKSYEMPYVHVKINKVISGKFPKTDVSISAGGALEQINFDDVESFTDSLVDKIIAEIDDAVKKLEPIQ